jgi:hypothetical protein
MSTFDKLPIEIIYLILSRLPSYNILDFCQSCRRYIVLLDDDRFWLSKIPNFLHNYVDTLPYQKWKVVMTLSRIHHKRRDMFAYRIGNEFKHLYNSKSLDYTFKLMSLKQNLTGMYESGYLVRQGNATIREIPVTIKNNLVYFPNFICDICLQYNRSTGDYDTIARTYIRIRSDTYCGEDIVCHINKFAKVCTRTN